MDDKEEAAPRPERRDAAENRQRILGAALRLFDRHGAGQVSMNQIATEAQIGPGTLYRRYRNKSELCLDLMKDNIVLLFDDIEAYLETHRDGSPSLRLRGIVSLFVGFREKKNQLLAGVEESPPANRTRPRALSPLYGQLHEILVAQFEEMSGSAQDNAAVQANAVFKADMLLVALSSESYAAQRDVRGLSPEEIVEQLGLTFFPERD
ncbi:TetR/AcrR family transcriptional regulator [Cohnella ginsengisoli]|uniref:TetR/AcrR family transcriptional regulator n=1 Tax=Cohnella ginsengisoli TaxID=425004 RepID=A0A9X4KMY4_9BACL|nr:TetR/AcrR family transcriptional regulator [Cohnella ginsengisoli]MDG0794983.1 TetR/AcrR family transcriptional regulator [Cohnella ginsengisoli]